MAPEVAAGTSAAPQSLPPTMSEAARAAVERLVLSPPPVGRRRLDVSAGPGGLQGEFSWALRSGTALGAFVRLNQRGKLDWGARLRWEF